MNKYLLAIYDPEEGYPFTQVFMAKSLSDAMEKSVRWFYDWYDDFDFSSEDFEELRKELETSYNILVGGLEEFID